MRKVERPHPVNPVRNPSHPEMWLSEQGKRNVEFSEIYGRLVK